MEFEIGPKTINQLALVLHRQNPYVVSLESARQDIESLVSEVVQLGRESDNGFCRIGTAGYSVSYSDHDGVEEVNIDLHLLTLFAGSDDDDPIEHRWAALKNFSRVDTEA